MPRGNPLIGQIKSPGRPPKRKLPENADAKDFHDEFIRENLPEYLSVMHEDAVERRNPKSAQALIERLLGKPPESAHDSNSALHALLRAFAAHRGVQLEAPIEGTFKEIDGPTDPSGGGPDGGGPPLPDGSDRLRTEP